MFPVNLVKPGLLEIKGNFSHSPCFYVPIRSIRSFVVHHRPATIELHLSAITPNGSTVLKCIDCKAEQLTAVAEFISDCISKDSDSNTSEFLGKMSERMTRLENDVSRLIVMNAAQRAVEEAAKVLPVEPKQEQLDEELDENIYEEEHITGETEGEESEDESEEEIANDTSDTQSVNYMSDVTILMMFVSALLAVGLNAMIVPYLCARMIRS
jgi:hypothetical protein